MAVDNIRVWPGLPLPLGATHELGLLASPWGFDLQEVSTPLGVWHGRQDGVVPHVMGELLAQMAPNAQLHTVANEGHVSLPVRHGVEILERLISPGRAEMTLGVPQQ